MRQLETKRKCPILHGEERQWKHTKVVYMFLLTVLLILTPILSVKAATSLKLKYDGKDVTYTGKQVVYKIDGKQVSKKNYPGIIIGSTSLISYKDAFVNSGIGVTATYSSSKGTLTLKKDYTTIKFTLGSTTVYVDGEKQTVSQAPRKVTYKSTGVTKILVPARFVAEAFGYTYSYNSSKAIATLTSSKTKPLNLYDFSQKKWFTYRGIQGKVKVDGKNVSVTSLPSILHQSTTMVQAKKVFASSSIDADYTYDSSDKTVTLVKDDVTVVMTLDSKTATVNGKAKTLPHAPMKIKNKANGTTYIMVPISTVAGYLGYDFAWDSSSNTSILTKKVEVTEPDVPVEDKQYSTYGVSDTYKDTITNIQNTKLQTEINSNYSTTAVLGDFSKDTVTYSDREVFYLKAYSTFSKVHSYYTTDNALVLDVERSTVTNSTYTYSNSIIESTTMTYNETSQSSKIVLTTSVKQPKYDIRLSEDALTLIVTVYYNYIENVSVDYTNGTDVVNIQTWYPATNTTTVDSSNVFIDLPYTINSIGTLNNTIENGYCIKGVAAATKDATSTRITLSKATTATYYSSQTGNVISYVLVYPDSDASLDLKISLPSGVDYSTVTTQDLYTKNQFKVIIPGDYVSYYNENPVNIYSSMVSKVVVSLNSSGNTEILISTLTLQGFNLTEGSSAIQVEIGNPQDIYDKIVVLDAGHGGSDPGTIHNSVQEKTITYNILYKYAKEYFNDPDSSIKAYWTRTGDNFVDLYERAAFAEKVGADLFISLHMNSATPSAKGTETYYSTVNNKTQDNGLNSAKLASIFQAGIVDVFGSNNRKVKTANYVVIKQNTVPAILIELGFMSNSDDFAKINNTTNQKKYAEKIYELTEDVFNQYPTGR
ncbi:N-acetylmuramoyl-L-alanine amidase [Anaerosporobacter faecicola]|uniref:N-acetylmuramoyl-L-alanine amidase n=1 Tax=Anaerosporobacter faecicola TaxID=2718714 RepID=UPI00143AFEEC|nr:N-acetylmuramoyl-L-alanine amidase [Anaerosporobacter faecicola]